MMYSKQTRAMWVIAALTEFMIYANHPEHDEDVSKLEDFVRDLKQGHNTCVHTNDISWFYCGTGKEAPCPYV